METDGLRCMIIIAIITTLGLSTRWSTAASPPSPPLGYLQLPPTSQDLLIHLPMFSPFPSLPFSSSSLAVLPLRYLSCFPSSPFQLYLLLALPIRRIFFPPCPLSFPNKTPSLSPLKKSSILLFIPIHPPSPLSPTRPPLRSTFPPQKPPSPRFTHKAPFRPHSPPLPLPPAFIPAHLPDNGQDTTRSVFIARDSLLWTFPL